MCYTGQGVFGVGSDFQSRNTCQEKPTKTPTVPTPFNFRLYDLWFQPTSGPSFIFLPVVLSLAITSPSSFSLGPYWDSCIPETFKCLDPLRKV